MRFERGLGRAVVVALLMATMSPVSAEAGKFCGDPVEGGKSAGSTQDEAALAAQKWWSSRAGSLGRGYEDWENAGDRALECTKGGDGTFYCKAVARPCLTPGTLPENVPKIDM